VLDVLPELDVPLVPDEPLASEEPLAPDAPEVPALSVSEDLSVRCFFSVLVDCASTFDPRTVSLAFTPNEAGGEDLVSPTAPEAPLVPEEPRDALSDDPLVPDAEPDAPDASLLPDVPLVAVLPLETPEPPAVLLFLLSLADFSRDVRCVSFSAAAGRAESVFFRAPSDELCAAEMPAIDMSETKRTKDIFFILPPFEKLINVMKHMSALTGRADFGCR
jgi:hypothetical protein